MLEDELLSTYCVSVLKNAEQIRNTVMRADVYEVHPKYILPKEHSILLKKIEKKYCY